LIYHVADDGDPSAQASGTLTVTVVAVNDPPTGTVSWSARRITCR
jgi:hypothetical protein